MKALIGKAEWLLEGCQFFATVFSGVGMAWLAHIIAETQSQEYNVYCRAMRAMPAAPDLLSCQFFAVEFSGVGMA